MAKTYKSKTAEGSYLRAFFGHAFLAPDDVEDFFINDLASTEPSIPEIRTFSTYVYNTYMHEGATYPPHIWAKYSADIGRTTNACESFNSKLNEMFYHSHPNIFLFIDALLEIHQKRSYTKMLSVATVKPRKKRIEKENYICAVMNDFENDVIDKFSYEKQLSRKFLPKKNIFRKK